MILVFYFHAHEIFPHLFKFYWMCFLIFKWYSMLRFAHYFLDGLSAFYVFGSIKNEIPLKIYFPTTCYDYLVINMINNLIFFCGNPMIQYSVLCKAGLWVFYLCGCLVRVISTTHSGIIFPSWMVKFNYRFSDSVSVNWNVWWRSKLTVTSNTSSYNFISTLLSCAIRLQQRISAQFCIFLCLLH